MAWISWAAVGTNGTRVMTKASNELATNNSISKTTTNNNNIIIRPVIYLIEQFGSLVQLGKRVNSQYLPRIAPQRFYPLAFADGQLYYIGQVEFFLSIFVVDLVNI